MIHAGDDLGRIILNALDQQKISLMDHDILVITQKIISKAEGRYVNLEEITPSEKAKELAAISEKDPRMVEVVLSESKSVLRCVKNTLIVEHRLGFVCANAGIDHSNVQEEGFEPGLWYLLLPADPDGSARQIRDFFKKEKSVNIGVLVIDSHGRAWREGITGTMIGTAGVPALVDLRGKKDLFGYELKITQVGAADELAAAASLLMGQADESAPVIHVRGFPYPLAESSIRDVIRPKSKDLFR